MRRLLLLSAILLVFLFVPACVDEALEEPVFGFGAKADELGCSANEELCWPSRDVIAMQGLLVSEENLLLEPEKAYRHQLAVFEGLRALDHKLSDDEREILSELENSPKSPEAILQDLQARVLPTLKGRFYASSMVPLGETLVGDAAERADHGDAASDLLPGERSEAVEASLERLHESGVAGKLYASMLVLSGVLTKDFEPSMAIGSPGGISREEAANLVITRYKRAAGLMGLGTGAVTLIPVVGMVVAIPLDAFATFSLHARLTFEVCAIYGWDMHQGTELFTMTMFMFSDGEFEEMVDELAASASLPNLIRAIGKQVGITVSVPLAVKISSQGIVLLMRSLVKLGEKLAIENTARGVFAKVVGTVLGWASAGLAVVGAALADYYVTDRLGEHVKLLSKRWLVDLPKESGEYLNSRPARDCFFGSLATIAQEDNNIAPGERALYLAFLDKSYYTGESSWYRIPSAERIAHAQTLAQAPGSVACLGSTFADQVAFQRVSVLSHMFAMLAIDRSLTAGELELYVAAQQTLQEKGAWNDVSLDPHMLQYVETVIFRNLNAAATEVPDDLIGARDSLVQEDLLTFLAETSPEVEADFRCGFANECQY